MIIIMMSGLVLTVVTVAADVVVVGVKSAGVAAIYC